MGVLTEKKGTLEEKLTKLAHCGKETVTNTNCGICK